MEAQPQDSAREWLSLAGNQGEPHTGAGKPRKPWEESWAVSMLQLRQAELKPWKSVPERPSSLAAKERAMLSTAGEECIRPDGYLKKTASNWTSTPRGSAGKGSKEHCRI